MGNIYIKTDFNVFLAKNLIFFFLLVYLLIINRLTRTLVNTSAEKLLIISHPAYF